MYYKRDEKINDGYIKDSHLVTKIKTQKEESTKKDK